MRLIDIEDRAVVPRFSMLSRARAVPVPWSDFSPGELFVDYGSKLIVIPCQMRTMLTIRCGRSNPNSARPVEPRKFRGWSCVPAKRLIEGDADSEYRRARQLRTVRPGHLAEDL